MKALLAVATLVALWAVQGETIKVLAKCQ
jgi:hypothetical protein